MTPCLMTLTGSFSRESAPAHKSCLAQQWLCDFVLGFIEHQQWPSGSPVPNVLDYQLWYDIEEDACSYPHTSLQAL
ncbi:hypothetical protein V9T40_004301 [Parthenolecanium corni]|uniref:Uncharacterized protein n=1 Tax=Parthenolecanium corni TaxID=536013 RepID=A0AAN9U399_9HEMI